MHYERKQSRLGNYAVFACLLVMSSAAVYAEEPLHLTDASFLEIDELMVAARGRPNEEARLAGLKSYQDGRHAAAAEQFQRAAYYADKYSQHYLSLMYWHGVGVGRDPVQAYIWSDLAAERGSRPMLAIREKIWSELTLDQQTQVQARGQDFYARYGDAVAKPRAESVMRQFARDMTGSRVGFRNQMMEIKGKPDNGAFVVATGSNAAAYMNSAAATPEQLYGEESGLRRLSTYWQQQDRLLEGKVEVGPLQNIPTPKGGNGMDG